MADRFDAKLQSKRDTRTTGPTEHANEQDGLAYEDEASANNDTNSQYTAVAVKEALQFLLRDGYVEASSRRKIYNAALSNMGQLQTLLEPLDLRLLIDDTRGLALLQIIDTQLTDSGEPDAWTHLLVRRQRFTLEQSLLVALLRQHFIAHEQEAGIGAGNAHLSVDELLPQLDLFLGDTGSDTRNEKRLRNLLDQLQAHGLVSEVDGAGQFTLRPLIAHLANPESLAVLLNHYRQLAEPSSASEAKA